MNTKVVLGFCAVIFLGLIGFWMVGAVEENTLALVEGKNLVHIQNDGLLLARDFVLMHPEIDAISYTDDEGNTVGYVRAFGGIGKNFVITSDVEYEVDVSQDTVVPLAP